MTWCVGLLTGVESGAGVVDDEPLPPPEVLRRRLKEPEISLEEAWRIFYERLRREAGSEARGCKCSQR